MNLEPSPKKLKTTETTEPIYKSKPERYKPYRISEPPYLRRLTPEESAEHEVAMIEVDRFFKELLCGHMNEEEIKEYEEEEKKNSASAAENSRLAAMPGFTVNVLQKQYKQQK